jgi:hypothetical protein
LSFGDAMVNHLQPVRRQGFWNQWLNRPQFAWLLSVIKSDYERGEHEQGAKSSQLKISESIFYGIGCEI